MPASISKPVKERRQAVHGLVRILRRQCDAMAGNTDPDLKAMLGIIETLRTRAHRRATSHAALWSEAARLGDALAEHLSSVIDGCIMRRQVLVKECHDFVRTYADALATESGQAVAALPTEGADQALRLFRSLRSQMRPTHDTASDNCSLCAG